jgi:uncharacterized membrane protein
MKTTYNHIAGQSIERLDALSDGIFGVAMTLLLLQLNIPDKPKIVTESYLLHALAEMTPRLLVYLMSFMTLGIFWIGQQAQFTYLKRFMYRTVRREDRQGVVNERVTR